MRCIFIINPKAGTNKIQRKLDSLIGNMVLQGIVNHVDVYFTKKKDDAYKRCLNLDPYDFVVSVGGDGTVNEIIRGLIESGSQIPLAILPGGTVNDFATHLNLPKTNNEFIQMIKDFNVTKVDVGKVNDLYFANVIACGMFTDISFQVSKEGKAMFGPLAYYAMGVRQLPRQLSTHMHLHIITNEEEFEEDASLFMVTNTSQVGGIKGIMPEASVQDGLLDLLIIKKCTPTELVGVVKDYTINNLIDSPYIKYLQSPYIKIESDSDLIYDIDGEEGTVLPIEVSVVKQQLNVIIPKEEE